MTAHWFRPERGGLRATGIAVSPHAPNAQHGSAVAAIVARAAEMVETAVPMDIVRLTVDLTKKVPVGLVTTETAVRRDGRRLQLLEVTVLVDGERVSRSEVLRLRRDAVADDQALAGVETYDALPHEMPPSDGPVTAPWPNSPMMQGIACTFETLRPGCGVYTLHLYDQLVEGEVMTPATRAAIAADLVMTAGGALPAYSLVNADVSLGMARQPAGELIRLAALVRVGASYGSAQGWLYDADGCFATVSKSLLVLGRVAEAS